MNRSLHRALVFLAFAGMALAVTLRFLPHPARTIVMSMSDYTFNGNNPTLRLRPGERVRFLVRNDESTPIRHNFEIVGLGVPCGTELEPGQSRVISVTVPKRGTFAYRCCTHRGMGGALVIGSP